MDETPVQHAVKRMINEIRNDDGKVQVVGKITRMLGESRIYIEDTTGEIPCEIVPDSSPALKEGMWVRIFGEVAFDPQGERNLNIILIQDMSKLDLDLYYKSLELMKEHYYEKQ